MREDFEAMEALHALKRAEEVKKNPNLKRKAQKLAKQQSEELESIFDDRASSQKKVDQQKKSAHRSMVRNGRK